MKFLLNKTHKNYSLFLESTERPSIVPRVQDDIPIIELDDD
jgi:hypothetical protein